MNKKILPTITTTYYSPQTNYEEKIKEVVKLKLKEVCLFLTGLKIKERKKLYQQLEKTPIKKIPFVHLKSDMELWELDFLVENYQAGVFNLHSALEYPPLHDFSKYRDKIYIENTLNPFNEKEIKNSAGICIDFSHLEGDRLLRPETYKKNLKIIKKYPCGCAHISAISEKLVYYSKEKIHTYDSHCLKDYSELDYLVRYRQYFPDIMAIELENSIKEQLKIKDYLQNYLLLGSKM